MQFILSADCFTNSWMHIFSQEVAITSSKIWDFLSNVVSWLSGQLMVALDLHTYIPSWPLANITDQSCKVHGISWERLRGLNWILVKIRDSQSFWSSATCYRTGHLANKLHSVCCLRVRCCCCDRFLGAPSGIPSKSVPGPHAPFAHHQLSYCSW